jgi:hypothetical protein
MCCMPASLIVTRTNNVDNKSCAVIKKVSLLVTANKAKWYPDFFRISMGDIHILS